MLDLLNQTISGSLFAFMLIFMRLGAAFFLIPGFSDTTVPSRIRLLFALAFSFLLTPVLQDQLPPQPEAVDAMVSLMVSETIVGALFGTVMRLLLTALEVCGQVISLNMGLANAFLFNPMFSSQSSLPAAILATTGLTLIFVTNLHHLIFYALVDTYSIFKPGVMVPTEDMAYLIARQTMATFAIGVQLAAPFILCSILFFMALGILARIMPQMQIFFIALPVQQLGGLVLLALGGSAILMFWIEYMDREIGNFLPGISP
jgi:flagellar biosynthesis protein FliR